MTPSSSDDIDTDEVRLKCDPIVLEAPVPCGAQLRVEVMPTQAGTIGYQTALYLAGRLFWQLSVEHVKRCCVKG